MYGVEGGRQVVAMEDNDPIRNVFYKQLYHHLWPQHLPNNK